MHPLTISTFAAPLGEMTALMSSAGLVYLEYTETAGKDLEIMAKKHGTFVPDNDAARAVKQQLDEYFSGHRRQFNLPLAPQGTPFQLAVWQVLRGIGYGETISYSEQAQRLGSPKAVRAVGGANGKNPISIIVPCHRVIGKGGALTGFAGGLERKAALLALEKRYNAG